MSRGPWAPLLVAAAAVALQLPTFDRTMSLMDEGHILQFADMLRRGGELYRDATLLPLPGAFYLLAGVFELVGPSIRAARWLVVLEFALLAAVVFALMRRLASPGWAWASVGVLWVYRVWAFPHWQMYSYSTTALVLLALALYAFVRFLESGGRATLAAAGLALGLGVFCKQDYGVAALVAINVALLVAVRSGSEGRAGLRLFAWLNGPAVAVGAATALHFMRQGLFLEMLQQTLLNHLFGIATFEYTSLPPLSPLLSPDPMLRTPFGLGAYAPAIVFTVDWEPVRDSFVHTTLVWDVLVKLFFYAPYAIAAAGALHAWRTREARLDPERRTAWLGRLALVATAAALVLALNKPVDYVHVAVLYWPLLLVVLLLVRSWVQGRPRRARALAAAALLPALAVAGYTARLGFLVREQFDTPLRGERAGVFVTAAEEQVIGDVVDWIVAHTRPEQRVAVLPYFPLVSFLAGRDAPHRAIYTFWPVAYIEDRERKIAAAIDASGSDVLVYHFTQWPQLTPMSEYAPELFAWLAEHYAIDAIFSDDTWGYKVAGLRRERGPPPGEPLLDEGPLELPVAIETRGGRRREVPPERRSELLRAELWPFRPVLAQRPLSQGRRSVFRIPVQVPEGARLRTAIGVHPSFWFRFPPTHVRFEIRAVADGVREVVFTRELRPHSDRLERGWHEVEVPLQPWAGREIELEFAASCTSPAGEVFEMAGWERPRLVRSPPATASLD